MKHDAPGEVNPGQKLDDLLKRYARQPIPPVPGDLESRVWREIRARRSHAQQSVGNDWLTRLLRLWREPRVAFAGVAAAVSIGIGMSWVAHADTRVVSTRQALGLVEFSAEAPSLPSTLLARQ